MSYADSALFEAHNPTPYEPNWQGFFDTGHLNPNNPNLELLQAMPNDGSEFAETSFPDPNDSGWLGILADHETQSHNQGDGLNPGQNQAPQNPMEYYYHGVEEIPVTQEVNSMEASQGLAVDDYDYDMAATGYSGTPEVPFGPSVGVGLG
ncbi:hypothetical protein H4R33_000102 [Dimargaris cristalligena]|nr:hypothetical protein H4R33_000102 [Dimargaris cristalligena]